MTGHSLEHLLSVLEIHVRSVALCAVGRGFRLFHEPSDAIAVHYVLEGEGWLEVEGSDPLPFRAGSVLIVPRDRWKRIGVARGAGADVDAGSHCRWAEDGLLMVDATGGQRPDIRFVCDVLSSGHASSLGLFDNLIDPVAEDLSDVPAARAAFDIVLAECDAPRFGSRALIETTVKQCLILALRRHYEQYGAQSPLFAPFRDARLVRIAGAVVRAPGDAYTLDALAASVGMSRSAFIKKFSESFGKSPMEFVAAVRLEAAARILRSSALPVKAVASTVGFASRSHFSRAFRARYGADPSRYRRKAMAAPPP